MEASTATFAARRRHLAYDRAAEVDAFTGRVRALIRDAHDLNLGPVGERLQATANQLAEFTATMRALAEQGHFNYQDVP